MSPHLIGWLRQEITSANCQLFGKVIHATKIVFVRGESLAFGPSTLNGERRFVPERTSNLPTSAVFLPQNAAGWTGKKPLGGSPRSHQEIALETVALWRVPA